jgi:flagellar biosynthesis anti-sigma factor FlgM
MKLNIEGVLMKELPTGMGTGVHTIPTRRVIQFKLTGERQPDMASWQGRVSQTEKRSPARQQTGRAVQDGSQNRMERIERLRSQVAAGTYKVDSVALAKKMLANETHFLQNE